VGDRHLWYESIGDKQNPTLILVMGYLAPATSWPVPFVNALAEQGYHVVRFDNRGIGLSTLSPTWSKRNPYYMDDLANDVIAILDDLGKKKAHIAGMSMGGMIAQTVAINHPERVESLISISSTGHFYDKKMQTFSREVLMSNVALIRKYGFHPKDPKKDIKKRVLTFAYLGQEEEITYERLTAITQLSLFETQERGGRKKQLGKRQAYAIKHSPARWDDLSKLEMPTLVIHGKRDPLITLAHGKRCADLIPNSKLVVIEDFGHIPSNIHWRQMASEMTAFLQGQDN